MKKAKNEFVSRWAVFFALTMIINSLIGFGTMAMQDGLWPVSCLFWGLASLVFGALVNEMQ